MFDVALENIPTELNSFSRWVCWRKVERGGKTTKLPINPQTGQPASTTDPTTWGTLTDACEAMNRYGCDGIGFVFTANDSYASVDLDKCRDPETGTPEPWAPDYLDELET